MSDLIEYASSDADIVAVDSKTGELKFTNTKFGEATITATLPKTATYQTSTDSYVVENKNKNKDNHIATSLSFNGTDITLTEGKTDAGADFTGYTATEASNIAGTITYAASDDAVATVNPTTGAVTINAAVYGTTTITATFTPADPTQYSGSTATYKITNKKGKTYYTTLAAMKEAVPTTATNNAPVTLSLNLTDAIVTSVVGKKAAIQDATAGILVYGNNAFDLVKGKKYTGKVDVKAGWFNGYVEIVDWTPSADIVVEDAAELPLETITLAQFKANPDKYEFKRVKVSKVTTTTAYSTAKKATITQDGTDATLYGEDTGLSVSINTIYDLIGCAYHHKTSYLDEYRIGIFAQEDITEIVKETPALSFAEATVTKELKEEIIEVQALTKPTDFDGTVTYKSDDDTVAEVVDNMIDLKKTGEVTITATSAATDKYAAGTASYKLIIKDNRTATAIAFEGLNGTTVALTDGKTADGAEFKGYTAKAADNIEGTIKYAASGDAVATVDETTGAVTINATTYGTTTITATFTPADPTKYTTSTAEYKITNEKGKIYYTTLAAMKQAVPTTATNSARATLSLNLTDAIVTSATDMKAAIQDATAGTLVYGNNALGLVKGKKYTGKVDVKACWFNGYIEIVEWTPSADIVVEDAAELPLETITLAQFKANPDKYEFKRVKVSKVTTTTAYSTAKKATITQDGTDATLYGEDTGLSVSINTIYDLIGCAYHHKTSYLDEYRIGIFAQEDITEIVKETPALSFAEATVTKELTAGTIDLQTITKPEDLDASAITYASSDNETAEVYEGQILMYKTGEVTITATSAATDKYAAGTASYKLVIEDNHTTDADFKFAAESYSADLAEATAGIVTFNAANVLQNPHSLNVTYTISPASANATIGETDGEALIEVSGTYTITATGAANGTYKETTATCTLNVTNGNETIITFIPQEDHGLGKDKDNNNNQGPDEMKKSFVTIASGNAWFNSDENAFCFYQAYQNRNNKTTISTTEGYITKIEFIGSSSKYSLKYLECDDTNFVADDYYASWTGSAQSVTFTTTKQTHATQIIVTVKTAKSYTLDETKTDNVIKDCAYANVTLQRTLEASHWNTFCVPFALDKDQVTQYFGEGTQLRTYEGRCENNIVYFATVDNIEAGKPYIMKPGNAVVKNPTFEGVSMVATGLDENGNPQAVGDASTVQMKGIYNHVTLVQDKTNIYIGAGNKFYYPADAEACQMNGLRAYFIVPEGTDIKKLRANLDGATTSLGEIFDTEESNTPVYNLQGQCVGNSLSTLKSGIYVQNGKKVVVK
ncbi:hypothetical protein [Leyella stercorea]|uniref:hypothetical protein n=1 Tax=Leyella stercorea TaxID=363265 RepID=UPI0026DC372E|nr:hypothetical protein [Leyella stercorea]